MEKINKKFIKQTEENILLIEETLKKRIRELTPSVAARKIKESGYSINSQNLSNYKNGITSRQSSWAIKMLKILL